MQYNPAAFVLASRAQRRLFDEVRPDAPISAEPSVGTVRLRIAAALRSLAAVIAPAPVGPVATPRRPATA